MTSRAGEVHVEIVVPQEHHDRVLLDVVAPWVEKLQAAPELDRLFFARYSVPDWQLRFRAFGPVEWLGDVVRPAMEEALERYDAVPLSWTFPPYHREVSRYGGDRGLEIAEHLFHHDSVACLALLDAERAGKSGRSRREYSLLFVERFLDLMGFDRDERLRYYAYAYEWTIEHEGWSAEDEFRKLDARLEALRPALVDLLRGATSDDPVQQWGGEAPHAIATACLERSRPWIERVVEGQCAGEIRQDRVRLAWSYTHMHSNRLAVDATPEAILRYFMHRLYRDGAI